MEQSRLTEEQTVSRGQPFRTRNYANRPRPFVADCLTSSRPASGSGGRQLLKQICKIPLNKVASDGRSQIALEFRGRNFGFDGASDRVANAGNEGRPIGAQTGEVTFRAPRSRASLSISASISSPRTIVWPFGQSAHRRPLAADELVQQD